MYYLILLYYYFTAFLKHLLSIKSSDLIFQDALISNFEYKTYRFPMHAPEDKLISLRILKMILKSLFVKGKFKVNDVNTQEAIFDLDISDSETRSFYIKRLNGTDVKLVVSRNELRNSFSPLIAGFVIFLLLLTYPFVILVSLLSKNRLKYPFHILNSIEAINLLYILKKITLRIYTISVYMKAIQICWLMF